MKKHQDKEASQEERYANVCNILTLALVLLVLCVAALHFRAATRQGNLIETLSPAQAQWNTSATDFTSTTQSGTGDGQSRIPSLAYVSMGLYLLILGLLAFLYLNIFRPIIAALAEQRKQLSRYAALDPLTGIYNRSMLFKVGRMLIGAYKRQEQPLAVLAIDIDNLRKTNDAYGRAAGDALIKKVATTITAALRSSDVIGRLGGGEIGVFLPSLDESRAIVVAEKVRLAIERMPFAVKEIPVLATVSIGVMEMSQHHDSPDALFLSAELALRRAKEEGGNRAVLFTFVETGNNP